MLSKPQKDALNTARAKASAIRKCIEDLSSADLENGVHLSISVEITNFMYDLEKALKH